MLAFHGNQQIKQKYLARVEAHRLADEIVQGQYWQNGKGCAVGCTLHSDEHADYETELGIPMTIAYLEDRIFEGLPNGDAKEFPAQFLNAIPVGADLSLVTAHFMVWLLADPVDGVIRFAREEGKAAIEMVVALYQRRIAGDEPMSDEWLAAAYAARAAAYAAADAAAYAAYAAADAAAYAAYAAADAAAYAARAAACGGGDAAAYAARAAAYAAADAAADAAYAAAYRSMRDKLLALLSEAPVLEVA